MVSSLNLANIPTTYTVRSTPYYTCHARDEYQFHIKKMDPAQCNFHISIYPFAGSITSLIKVIQIGCRHILADMHVFLFVLSIGAQSSSQAEKSDCPSNSGIGSQE